MNTFSYQVHPQRRLVMVTYHARPTYDEIAAILTEIVADPAYRPGYGILLDRRLVGAGSTSYVQRMVRLVDHSRKKMGDTHWAILVSDMESFGMGRMAEQLTEFPNSIRAFRDIREAELWLLSNPVPPTFSAS